MARYIDAERLKEAFATDTQHIRDWDVDLFDLLMLDIDEAPTADVAEVRHGYWKEERYSDEKWADFKCSVCDFDDTFYRNLICFYKYCPNCGAKMDGKVQNEG